MIEYVRQYPTFRCEMSGCDWTLDDRTLRDEVMINQVEHHFKEAHATSRPFAMMIMRTIPKPWELICRSCAHRIECYPQAYDQATREMRDHIYECKASDVVPGWTTLYKGESV